MDDNSSDKPSENAESPSDEKANTEARSDSNESRGRDDSDRPYERRGRDDSDGPYESRERPDEPPERTHDLSRTQSAPRRKHGTRMIFNFTCSGCGTASSLDYRPKVGLNEILCASCMGASDNSDRWKIVRERKEYETRLRSFEYKCTSCDRVELRARKVREPKTFLCDRCFQDQAIPNPSRLAGAESVDGLMKVRRRKVVAPDPAPEAAEIDQEE